MKNFCQKSEYSEKRTKHKVDVSLFSLSNINFLLVKFLLCFELVGIEEKNLNILTGSFKKIMRFLGAGDLVPQHKRLPCK